METLKFGKQSFSFQRAAHFHINGGILGYIVLSLTLPKHPVK